MSVARHERTRDDLVSLAHRGSDVGEFSLGAARVLGRAVGFDGFCLLTFDPATLMPTGEVVKDGLPEKATPRLAEIEVAETDFNNFRELAHAELPAATLSAATEGDLDRSLRHRELRGPGGFGDELRVTLVAEDATWGAITLLRRRGAADFTEGDVRLMAAFAPYLAQGLRRAIAQRVLTTPEAEAEQETGVVLIGEGNAVLGANDAGRALLEELMTVTKPGEAASGVLAAVAGLARRAAAGEVVADASARVQAPSGRWLRVQGSLLDDGNGAVVVVLEPVRPTELAPLIADAYGLTARERAITQLVTQGFSTAAISERLFLSQWTVQDHLKSIFEKTGVGTRGELVARLFFEHHLPRLADPAGQ